MQQSKAARVIKCGKQSSHIMWFMTDVDTTREPHIRYTMTDLARCGGILRFRVLGPPEHIPVEDIFPLLEKGSRIERCRQFKAASRLRGD